MNEFALRIFYREAGQFDGILMQRIFKHGSPFMGITLLRGSGIFQDNHCTLPLPFSLGERAIELGHYLLALFTGGISVEREGQAEVLQIMLFKYFTKATS